MTQHPSMVAFRRGWVGSALLSLWLLCIAGCGNALVGAECREELTECSGACVDLQNDEQNCGECGHVCASGNICSAGMCVAFDGNIPFDGALPDGSVPDGTIVDGTMRDGFSDDGPPNPLPDGALDGQVPDGEVPDGQVLDGQIPDGQIPDGQLPDGQIIDAGPKVCDIGELLCDEVCVRPDTDRNNCGECGNRCEIGEVCSDGMCAPACAPDLTLCGSVCVDTETDVDNCGDCDIECESGICETGDCLEEQVGHIVVIGHDYRASREGMNRIVGNAVLLARGTPVRVLAYEGDAITASIAGTNQAINQTAGALGRTWMRNVVTADEVPLRLAQSDAFVIYSQQQATDTELNDLGVAWSTALASFLRRGGVIVLLEGGGAHNGTFQILQSAGWFTAASRTNVTGSDVDVVAPGDAVALGVPLRYRAEMMTFWFDTTETTAVVRHADGPVVIHRIVFP